MDLFRARGWTTVITNNLVGYVLSFTTFTVGVCCGFFGILVERLASQHFGDDNEMNSFVFGPIPGTKFWAFG